MRLWLVGLVLEGWPLEDGFEATRFADGRTLPRPFSSWPFELRTQLAVVGSWSVSFRKKVLVAPTTKGACRLGLLPFQRLSLEVQGCKLVDTFGEEEACL